jgi:hypothetical protein
VDSEKQLRDFLNAEFAGHPRAFLRRVVKAIKTSPDRCRPANTTIQGMIDFIIEVEKQRPSGRRETKEAAIEHFNRTSFLIVRRPVCGC